MSNGTGDLIQTTLESWPDNLWCGATTVFGSFGQYDGSASPVSGTDKVKIVYDLSGTTWTQTVTNADTGGAYCIDVGAGATMTGYGTGTECDDGCCGIVAAHTYETTEITLLAADITFGSTIATCAGATYIGLASSSGGKVWTIASMNIPALD